jgi:hypothetical protein
MWPPVFGLGTVDQDVPFQVSTSVSSPALPTAVHELVETQDTPLRTLTAITCGSGVGATDQLGVAATGMAASADITTTRTPTVIRAIS